MYIALGLMFLGILAGRLFRSHISRVPLQPFVFCSVLLLLFLLGLQIGANDRLFADLPHLGTIALIITVCCMAGSILAVLAIYGAFNARHGSSDKADEK